MRRNASFRTPHGNHAHMLPVHILVFVYVGLFAVVWASTSEFNTTWLCLHCTGAEDPSDCNAFRACREPMICSASSYITPSGRVLYDMGCKHALHLASPTFAPSTALPSQMTMTPGSDRKRYLCDRLCFSHFCNYRLCPSYKSRTNTRCVSCSDVGNPIRCERITTCSSYEVCMYQEYLTDMMELRYSMGCVNKQVCDSSNERRKRQLAINCCDTDFCNMVSAVGVTSTAASTIFIPTSTSLPTTSTTITPSAMTSPTATSTSGTAAITRPTQRITNGPICLSCQSFNQRQGCTTVEACQSDQMCYLSVNQSVKGLTYSSGCTSKTLCSGWGSTIVGKRSNNSSQMAREATVQRCFQCCDFNFCNYDLCPSITISNLVG